MASLIKSIKKTFSNLNNYIASTFLNFSLKNIFKNIKKFKILCFIIFYVIKYYFLKVKNIWKYWIYYTKDYPELKSFLLSFGVAFLFYYFVVIELSILIWGYSLLCYRLAFILLFIFLIYSWRLEVHYLKNEIPVESVHGYGPEFWPLYYEGKTPYSFYDYITNYYRWGIFHQIIIAPFWEKISDGRETLFVYFTLLFFFAIYGCFYKFDPRFVKFVARYFKPTTSFYSVRSEPRLEDIFSAPILTRDSLMSDLWYVFADNTWAMKILSKIPDPSLDQLSRATWTYNNKHKLKPGARFSDIFFLWEVIQHPTLKALVFTEEPPMILSSKFQQNKDILFLWYVSSEFNKYSSSYWVNYFENDPNFWTYISILKKNLEETISETLQRNSETYSFEGYNKATFYELLLSKNFLNYEPYQNEKLSELYGKNLDFYESLVSKSTVKKIFDFDDFFPIFTSTATKSLPSDLPSMLKWTWNSNTEFDSSKFFWAKYESFFDNIFFFKKKKSLPSLKDLKYSLLENNNVEFFSWRDFMKLDPLLNITDIGTSKWSVPRLRRVLWYYDFRLIMIEKLLKLGQRPFPWVEYKNPTWSWIIYLLYAWTYWIEQELHPGNVYQRWSVYIPSWLDLERYYWVYNSIVNVWNRPVPPKKIKKKNQKIWFKQITKNTFKELLEYENWIWGYERIAFKRMPLPIKDINIVNQSQQQISSLADKNSKKPWYIEILSYFSEKDDRLIMPGFVRYFTPTPYLNTFSTIGNSWFTYNFFTLKNVNNVIAESDVLLTASNTTPFILYTNVEAILYLKPFLNFLSVCIDYIIKFITYPLEFIINTSFLNLKDFTGTLILVIHLTWFINYYIYLFVAYFILRYMFKYAYEALNFSWIHENMIETIILTQNNHYMYWHSMDKIWFNYRSPDQILTLKLNTLSLLNFSTYNQLNYLYVKKKSIEPIINIFLRFSKDNYINIIKNISFFELEKKNLNKKDFYYTTVFFYLTQNNYSALVHKGGSDVNTDTLVWNYFNYLSQVSIFLSRSLWWNKYNITGGTYLTSLIKQFTVAATSSSMVENDMFLISPLLDNNFNWKILKNLVFELSQRVLKKKFINVKNINELKSNKDLVNYIILKSKIYELLNLTVSSSQNIYSILNSIPYYISKLNVKSCWDNQLYWIIIFFWSFWFVPRHKYPYINFNNFHEYAWNSLAKTSYSNSWIAHSVYSRPFFSLTQHIWWSSSFSRKSKSITNLYYNTNSIGLNNIDQVRNFQEKRYSKNTFNKTETVFGIVRTLNIPEYYYDSYYGKLINYDNNFDRTYDENKLDKFETFWGYNKVNPPINCTELGVTPEFLINLFSDLPKGNTLLFLSFFDQLNLIKNNTYFSPIWKTDDLYCLDKETENEVGYVEPDLINSHDFYTKKYKYLLKENSKVFFENWIFGFDTSYFFNFFMTWDYFSTELNSLRPNKLNYEENFLLIENLISMFSLEDMNSKLTSSDHFLKKPVGSLDKSELFALKKYQFLKSIDYLSLTKKKESPYHNYDTETLISEIGLAIWPNSDVWTIGFNYDEAYFGLREKRTPYNLTTLRNSTSPILLGWVGELYNNTNAISSFYFSLMYSYKYLDANNHKKKIWSVNFDLDDFQPDTLTLNLDFKSYFGFNYHSKYLQSKAYSWVNLFLNPYNNWYFFGLKPQARLDYWSWKCGYQLDYKNGFFSCRPYLGLRYSLGSWLNPVDSVFGFYWPFRQIDNDINEVDLSTDVFHVMLEGTEDITDTKPIDPYTFAINAPENWDVRDMLASSFRQIFFCFQHPFFLGYFMFWYLVCMSKDYNLGLVNFSLRWTLSKKLMKNYYSKKIDFKNFRKKNWKLQENLYRKQMYRYWIYWMNPSLLTNNFLLNSSDLKDKNLDLTERFYNFFSYNFFSFFFLKKILELKNHEIILLLNFNKKSLNLIKINWLSLDNPFTLNPFIIEPYFSSRFFKTNQSYYYATSHLKFSYYDSLWENINFNNLIDWSSGSYLDVINLSFYYSSFWSATNFPATVLDNPTYLTGLTFNDQKDESFLLAEWEKEKSSMFVSDLVVENHLLLYNLSILKLLSSIYTSSAKWSLNISEFTYIKFFNDLFFPQTNDNDFSIVGTPRIGPLQNDDLPISYTHFTPFSWFKHTLYYRSLTSLNTFDVVNMWFRINPSLAPRISLRFFLNSLKYKFYAWIELIKSFYTKIGFYIKTNFF